MSNWVMWQQLNSAYCAFIEMFLKEEERSLTLHPSSGTVSTFYNKTTRKFSQPCSSSNTLQVQCQPHLPGSSTKRRLSQVGAVVSRRLSTTIGWRTLGPSANSVIVSEAKGLCAQYIRSRFRRSGIFHRKLGLQRLRSVVNMTASYGSCDTYSSLHVLGQELESRHPKLYRSVCRQICRTVTSEEVVHDVFNSVAQEIISNGETITWARVVALFAVAGGLAVDCVQQGHVDYVLKIIEIFGQFIERDVAPWISQQGGWNTLMKVVSPDRTIQMDAVQATIILIGFFSSILIIYAILYICI